MKRWLLVLLMAVALAPGFVSGQDTAYKALRAVGAQRGERSLNQVLAIVGQSGKPQPVAWEIMLSDPAARGGQRELDVVSGQISSERTPATARGCERCVFVPKLPAGPEKRPSTSAPSMKFIGGDPMKPATKRLAGALYIFAGVSSCCSTPFSSRATR